MTETNKSTDVHSPGPWKAQPVTKEDFRRPNEDGANDICIVAADGTCPGIVWDYGREGEANACLIAAAPDLLASLKLLYREMELSGNLGSKDYGWRPATLASQTAIAKAEGRDHE